MHKARLRAKPFVKVFVLFALYILSPLLYAEVPSIYLIKNDLLNLKASKFIDTIGQELEEKTGLHAYVIATNEHFVEGFNLVEYSKQYKAKLSKPYVLFIFAPYATIVSGAKERGRIGIIPSSTDTKKLYSYNNVRDAAIKVVALKDSNTDEAKFNVGIVQAYSELADELAQSKNIKLVHIIPNEMGGILTVLRVLVYFGAIIVLWIFLVRPIWIKIKSRQKNG